MHLKGEIVHLFTHTPEWVKETARSGETLIKESNVQNPDKHSQTWTDIRHILKQMSIKDKENKCQ